MSGIKNKFFSKITTIPPALQSNYYPALDGLRGIAILMVILPHFGINRLFPTWFRIESITGVDLFFVLSGFLITTLLIKEKLKYGQVSLKNFYMRRVLRIIPLAYLFLIVLIFISIVYAPMSSISDFMLSFLFLKNLPIPNHPFTASLWTLSVEEQFYVFLPVLIFLSIERYFTLALFVLVLIPVISIVSFYHIGGYGFDSSYISKMAMYLFWKGPTIILVGSIIAILTFKGVINIEQANRYRWLSFLLLLIAIVMNVKTFVLYNKYISEYLSAIVIGYVILLSTGTDNLLSKILSSRILMGMGVLSYSLYIWQQLFIGNLIWIPGLKFLNSYPVWVIMIIKLVILFPIAYVSYQYFEKRFLKLKDRYKQSVIKPSAFNP